MLVGFNPFTSVVICTLSQLGFALSRLIMHIVSAAIVLNIVWKTEKHSYFSSSKDFFFFFTSWLPDF